MVVLVVWLASVVLMVSVVLAGLAASVMILLVLRPRLVGLVGLPVQLELRAPSVLPRSVAVVLVVLVVLMVLPELQVLRV